MGTEKFWAEFAIIINDIGTAALRPKIFDERWKKTGLELSGSFDNG